MSTDEQQIRDLVETHTKARYLGRSKFIEKLASDLGFEAHDLCIVNVLLGKRSVSLICVPHGSWKRPEVMARVRTLRQRAKASSHNVVLVPQSIVERQPRLGNASIIGVAGKNVSVDATSRMTVLSHLIENGDCALSDLASLIDHIDPYGAVLSLVSAGVLRIQLTRCISPHSLVGLPDRDEERLG